MEESTLILSQYYDLLKEFFYVKNSICNCKDFNKFKLYYYDFWGEKHQPYINSLIKLKYKSYYSGTNSNYQMDIIKYLNGEYYFYPDVNFNKMALFSDQIMISDYAGDHLVFLSRISQFDRNYDYHLKRLGLNVHQLFDLEKWVKLGIIKLLPLANYFKNIFPDEYKKIDNFRNFYLEIPEFNSIYKKEIGSLEVIESMYPGNCLFALREAISFQERVGIIPVFTEALSKTSKICGDILKEILPDSQIFYNFINLKSNYLDHTDFNTLMEIRKEGYLELIRSFIREEFVKALALIKSGDYSSNIILKQFEINFNDRIESAENEWTKINKKLSKARKKSTITHSIIFSGSLLTLFLSNYTNYKIIEVLVQIIGMSSLREFFGQIHSKKYKDKLKVEKEKLIFKNPGLLFLK